MLYKYYFMLEKIQFEYYTHVIIKLLRIYFNGTLKDTKFIKLYIFSIF